MIIVGPALPSTAPAQPKERFINLVAMKQYDEWFNTWCTQEQYEAYHFGPLTFAEKHERAVQWAQQQDHDFDAGRGDYYR
jgi:hypothetical protein